MSTFAWMRFWFKNSYDLWRTHPTWRGSRWFATQRGIRAALAGWRQGLHKPARIDRPLVDRASESASVPVPVVPEEPQPGGEAVPEAVTLALWLAAIDVVPIERRSEWVAQRERRYQAVAALRASSGASGGAADTNTGDGRPDDA